MDILLVDDHALFLAGMENFLTTQGFQVVGLARNGAESQMKYEMLRPDLVLMDLQMEGCDGIETTRAIKRDYPEAQIIMLTAIADESDLFAAIEAGAEGYLLKDMEPEHFLRQLQGIAAGEVVLAASVGKKLLREFVRCKKSAQEAQVISVHFTDRQQEILQCMAEGMIYKEIAEALSIKEATVKYQVREMISKVKAVNRTELLIYVCERGIIKKK